MKEKIQNWLKNRENKVFLALIIFAIVIRFYYFLLTKDQPLWWDEADYLNMTKHWTLGLYYEFLAVRPLLFSMILVPLFEIANNEFLPRILMALLSLSTVIGTYYLGKEIYNHKIGLISGFLMSVFYLNLFFTERFLVDIPSLAFFIFSALFFYKYFKTSNPKFIYIAAVIVAFGTLIRLQTAVLLFVVLIYVLITQKLSFIKKKEMWISAIIFILILSPYVIWGYYQFNGFIITEAGKFNAAQSNFLGTGLNVLKQYLFLFPNYIFSVNDSIWWLASVLILAGLFIAYIFNLILGFDRIFKGKNEELERILFVALIFLVPLLATSFLIAHNEDRYILTCFPGFFIILGYFTILAFDFIKNKNKSIAPILLLFILLVFFYLQIQQADSLIKLRLDSYSQVKDAGTFLKENAGRSEVAISNSMLQLEYYSEIKVLSIPGKKEDFEALLASEGPSYLVISGFEYIPDWIKTYPQETNMTLVNAFFMDLEKTQPAVIIYRFN